jgi:hypothetical protein
VDGQSTTPSCPTSKGAKMKSLLRWLLALVRLLISSLKSHKSAENVPKIGAVRTCEIQLTKGKIVRVDADDFERVNKFKWSAVWNPNTKSYYAVRGEGPRKDFRLIRMHRFIANTPENMICDHINHNTLDNRKHNLRNCTPSQSMMNRRLQSNNRTGYTGVFRYSTSFQARVRVGGKVIFQKNFRTLDEAVKAREEAVKKYHGEFARK